jgi:hypothetical protein
VNTPTLLPAWIILVLHAELASVRFLFVKGPGLDHSHPLLNLCATCLPCCTHAHIQTKSRKCKYKFSRTHIDGEHAHSNTHSNTHTITNTDKHAHMYASRGPAGDNAFHEDHLSKVHTTPSESWRQCLKAHPPISQLRLPHNPRHHRRLQSHLVHVQNALPQTLLEETESGKEAKALWSDTTSKSSTSSIKSLQTTFS